MRKSYIWYRSNIQKQIIMQEKHLGPKKNVNAISRRTSWNDWRCTIDSRSRATTLRNYKFAPTTIKFSTNIVQVANSAARVEL